MRSIEVVIDARGEVRLQTKGYTGAECRQASAEIEKALGIVQSDQPTAEMYTASTASQTQTTRS